MNRSIKPVQNRELLHDLLRLLVFLVDWPVAVEIRLLCTAAVLARPGCTDKAAIIPACWSLIPGVRGEICTVPARFSVDLSMQPQRSKIQFINPLHFLAWISWSQLASYSSYCTRGISLNPLLIPSRFLHLSWWRFFSRFFSLLLQPPRSYISRSPDDSLALYLRIEVWLAGLVHLEISSWSPPSSSILLWLFSSGSAWPASLYSPSPLLHIYLVLWVIGWHCTWRLG